MELLGPLTFELEAVSLLGLLASLVGFGFAVWQIMKTRNAAEQATVAAIAARQAVLQVNSISFLIQARVIIDELKSLHRNRPLDPQTLGQIAQKYAQIQSLLADVEANLPEELWGTFDYSVDELTDMEESIDIAISSGGQPELSSGTFTRRLSEIQNTIQRVRVGLERRSSDRTATGD